MVRSLPLLLTNTDRNIINYSTNNPTESLLCRTVANSHKHLKVINFMCFIYVM